MLRELVRGLVAVAYSVAEPADPEELEVVLRRVDLFSTRKAEFSTLPFPHWQYFSLPANPRENAVGTGCWQRFRMREVIRGRACVGVTVSLRIMPGHNLKLR